MPMDTVVDGTAKAWVNFNGTGTVAIRASFNVSSITDNGTGQYTVNFATSLSDTNYAIVVTAGVGSSTAKTARAPTATPTVSACSVETTNAAQTAFEDSAYVGVSIFR